MKNNNEKLRLYIKDIFTSSVKAADPYEGVMKYVTLEDDAVVIDGIAYPFELYDNLYIVGGGKASARMGQAIEHIIGQRITNGWINTKDGHAVSLKKITVHECSHPVPDQRGVEGTRKIIEILETADERSLVICLLSGGGSALMPAPAEGITLAQKQEVTRLLLGAGADIGEINTIRKHLSSLKGGGMARITSPARLHMLILSDVIGDRLDTIASGPAVIDATTFSDCVEICKKYDIYESLPAPVKQRFKKGVQGAVPETAKLNDAYLEKAVNTIIGNNTMSVTAAKDKAERLGFRTLVLSTLFSGEASELGTFFGAIASEIQSSGNPVSPPVCIIGGGETTVTIQGKGKGGRNQEMALSAARALAGKHNLVFLSGGTDGTDGPTDAAGGIVDGFTISRGIEKGISAEICLKNNDSYHYLKETGGLLVTGPTGTNVMDIQVLLIGGDE